MTHHDVSQNDDDVFLDPSTHDDAAHLPAEAQPTAAAAETAATADEDEDVREFNREQLQSIIRDFNEKNSKLRQDVCNTLLF